MKNPWSLGARFLLNRNLRRAPSGCPPQWLKAGIRFLILHRCWFRSGKKNETQTHFSPLLPSTQQLFIKHNCWGRRRRRCVHNAALESLEAATSGRKCMGGPWKLGYRSSFLSKWLTGENKRETAIRKGGTLIPSDPKRPMQVLLRFCAASKPTVTD